MVVPTHHIQACVQQVVPLAWPVCLLSRDFAWLHFDLEIPICSWLVAIAMVESALHSLQPGKVEQLVVSAHQISAVYHPRVLSQRGFDS